MGDPRMSSSFSKFGYWLVRKLVMVLLVGLVGFATVGLWLFVRDADGYENARGVHAAYRAHCERELAALDGQIAELDATIVAQDQRAAVAGRVIKTLRELDNTWDRLIWNHAQQQANDGQMARMEALQKSINGELVKLRRERVLNERARHNATEELCRAARTLADQDRKTSLYKHYSKEAWYRGRCYVALILAVYLLGPTLTCLGLYYGLAPVVARGRPLRLADEPAAFSTIGAGAEVVESALWPGQVFRGKKKFFATADDDLVRKARMLMSWRFPFSSLACGLFNLVEMRNVRNDGGRRITLAGPGTVADRFKVVDVPEGGSLVLRPAFLAGLIFDSAEPPVIRRHWRFFHWQAWLSGQFRFFEFAGPCRLIVAGDDTLKAERLGESGDAPVPVFRVKQSKVAAFTPNLECRPVRAISFWRYYIGAARLFEAGFSGHGLVVYATPGVNGGIKSASVFRRILKVFGL
jgi:hypothetical protein